MRRFFSFLLVFSFVLTLSACGDNPHDELIDKAIKELQSLWQELYDNSDIETERYFEIKNTRVMELKKNDVEDFKNIDYIIEFVLFTDYYGASPYYSNVGISDSVIVYNDGTMEVPSNNLFRAYTGKTYVYNYEGIIETVTDYGDEYNCVEILK